MKDEDITEVRGEPIAVDLNNDCVMCATMIKWLREAWPEDKLNELPDMQPHERAPVLKVHGEQGDFMPFCQMCARLYMQVMNVFHQERQAREGEEQKAMVATVKQKIVTPPRQIVLPGQPGFKT